MTATITGSKASVKKEWHPTTSGRYAMSLYADGITVRVQQRKAGGAFYRVFGHPEDWRSLETTDQDEAQRRAEAFVEALVDARARKPELHSAVTNPVPRGLVPSTGDASAGPAGDAAGLTVAGLFALYLESDAFRKNAERTKAGDLSRARILVAGLGPDLPVSHLSDEVLTAFVERRRAGGIAYDRPHAGLAAGAKRCKSEPAGQRSLGADVRLLKTALLWAHGKKKVNGHFILTEMPIRKFAVAKNKSPRRPLANVERYRLTLDSLEQLALEAVGDDERRLWLLTAFALILVEATGPRITAVLRLRWRDLAAVMDGTDIPAIYWSAENDKKRVDRWSPTPSTVAAQIDAFRRRLGAAGASEDAWVFGQIRTPERPCSHDQLGQKLLAAEQRAGLTKLAGGVWHPYRRKWATDRKDLPVKDVMAAGGWEDLKTYHDSYTQADPHTMAAVVEHRTKLHDGGKLSAGELDATHAREVRRRTTDRSALRLVG